MEEEGGEAKQNKFYSFDEGENKTDLTKEDEEILNSLKAKRKKQFQDELPEAGEVEAEEKEKKPGIFERVKGEYERRKFISQKGKELKTKKELQTETEKLTRIKEERKLQKVKEEVRSYRKSEPTQQIRERMGQYSANRERRRTGGASTLPNSPSRNPYFDNPRNEHFQGRPVNPMLAGSGSPLARSSGNTNPLMAGSGNRLLGNQGKPKTRTITIIDRGQVQRVKVPKDQPYNQGQPQEQPPLLLRQDQGQRPALANMLMGGGSNQPNKFFGSGNKNPLMRGGNKQSNPFFGKGKKRRLI